MYLLMLPLSAVFASPVRSYTMLKRGARFFQFGMSGTSPNDRAGTKRPGSTARAWISELKYSQRSPGLIVRRFSVHESCR